MRTCSIRSRRIHKPRFSASHLAKVGQVAWPSFQGNENLVGTSPSGRVTVYVDAGLPQAALQNAQDLIADADRVVRANDLIFGTTGGPVNVVIFALGGATDGSGGADHSACDYVNGGNIEVCASYGNSMRCSALFEAELSECSMNGQLCGLSTGEALSRWCSAVICQNVLADFATAPYWVQNGSPDFVNTVDQTDENGVSIGCGMAFISWLLAKVGVSLGQIAQSMVALGDTGSLAQLYARLTGGNSADALPRFTADIAALPHGIQNDDPFFGLQVPPPGPVPTPAPAPPPPAPVPVPTPPNDATLAFLSLQFIYSLVDPSDTGKANSRTLAAQLTLQIAEAGNVNVAQMFGARINPVLK